MFFLYCVGTIYCLVIDFLIGEILLIKLMCSLFGNYLIIIVYFLLMKRERENRFDDNICIVIMFILRFN